LLALAVQTGLRLTEITGLDRGDVALGAGAHLTCIGKGRKQRTVPLTTNTVAVLRTWTRERGGLPADPLFPTRTGRRLSPDAVQRRVGVHVSTASQRCPSLAHKNVTPHTLRHTAAMALLQAGVDVSVIALWLGHEDIRSTQTYLHADLTIKQRALEQATPTSAKPGRFQPADPLLAFLEAL
jgi:integrase